MSETSFLERVVGLDTTRGTLMKEVLPDKKKRILTSRYLGGQFALMNFLRTQMNLTFSLLWVAHNLGKSPVKYPAPFLKILNQIRPKSKDLLAITDK